ncbi:MAG: arginase [Ignavibacteria bacterium]|nr:MAG: arginase [Ignavibacteria bacterium]KAF0160837.1 MAG: arginase [Ignavibacteria bacterium]
MKHAAISKHIDIFGFPMDLGAGRRGVDMGPSALRIAGIEHQLEQIGYRVTDHGDVFIKNQERQVVKNQKLKYLDEILRTTEMIAKKVEKSLALGNFPLCIGGDHSMAIGTLAGVAAHCKKHKQELGLIWIDAHADMNTDATTPSGNIHGMSVAASLGLGSKALSELYGFSPKIKPENIAFIGIRSIDTEERETIKKLGLKVYTMTEIDRKGINYIINKVLKDLKSRVQHIHVSFDADCIDPSFAPGVGTPVSGGLNYREAHLLMETIAECGCMSSLEVAEVNPILDNKNRSAEITAELIASSLGLRIL